MSSSVKTRFMAILVIIFLTVTLNQVSASLIQDMLGAANLEEDARLNFTELTRKYKLKCDTYNVTTEDGYILTIFNVVGNRSRPVFLMHGFLDSADTYLVRLNYSLVFHLHNAGYDLWIGNMRGNKYSRAHVKRNPDTDSKYWDFSFHEIGYYDMAATIDFILNKTSQTKLQAIGHSQGTSIFFVLCSTRPEYSKKIKVFIAMAPIAYLNNSGQPLSTISELGPFISNTLKVTGKEELMRNTSDTTAFLKLICTTILIGNVICEEGYFQTVFGGRDNDTFDKDFLPMAATHYFCGTSRKNGDHLSQIRTNFNYYDYGFSKNLEVYNSIIPPNYNLKNISMKIALLVGKNDKASTVKDAQRLRDELPNVVYHKILEREEMNHFDFVWGKHAYVYLYPHIYKILEDHY